MEQGSTSSSEPTLRENMAGSSHTADPSSTTADAPGELGALVQPYPQPGSDDTASANAAPNSNQVFNPGGWISWKLEWWHISLICTVQAGIVSGLVTVIVISHQRGGLLDLKKTPDSAVYEGGFFFIPYNPSSLYSLLWITIPTLVFVINRLTCSGIFSGLVDRAPYEELGKTYPHSSRTDSNGEVLPERNKEWVSLDVSVLLDYKSLFIFVAIWTAFRNRHILVALTMILDIILQVVIVPLSSGMLYSVAVDVPRNVTISISQRFNNSRLGISFSYTNNFAVVGSIVINEAEFPAWTTQDYAFLPYEAPSNNDNPNPYQVQVNTTAYTVDLGCENLGFPLPDISDRNSVGPLAIFRTTDRDCTIEFDLRLQENTDIVFKTDVQRCRSDAGRSRFIVIAAIFDRQREYLLRNATLLSCIPKYESVTGILQASFNGSSARPLALNSFTYITANSDLGDGSTLGTDFERPLSAATEFEASTNPLNANTFGRLAYSYGGKINPSSPLNPETVEEAVKVVFKTMFTTLVNRALLEPREEGPRTVDGIVIGPVLRLMVNGPIAWVLAGVHIFLLAWLLLIKLHVQRFKRASSGEPHGCLTLADISTSPGTSNLIKRFRSDPGYEGKYTGDFTTYLVENWDVKNSQVRFDNRGMLEFKLVHHKQQRNKVFENEI